MVTVNDLYAFDANAKVASSRSWTSSAGTSSSPRKASGIDNSPVAHMWRTIERPDAPLLDFR